MCATQDGTLHLNVWEVLLLSYNVFTLKVCLRFSGHEADYEYRSLMTAQLCCHGCNFHAHCPFREGKAVGALTEKLLCNRTSNLRAQINQVANIHTEGFVCSFFAIRIMLMQSNDGHTQTENLMCTPLLSEKEYKYTSSANFCSLPILRSGSQRLWRHCLMIQTGSHGNKQPSSQSNLRLMQMLLICQMS